MSRVPGAPAEITRAWLQEALRGAPAFFGVDILGVNATPIGVGYGHSGVVARLSLRTRGEPSPVALVAKLARAPRGTTEIAFYEQVGPRMPIRIPMFFGGQVDEAADRAVLLLEDIANAVQGDVVRGATVAQARATLDAIARFQAAFLIEGADTLPLRRWDGRASELAERVLERGERFLERYGEGLDDAARRHVVSLSETISDAVAVLAESPPTLVHSDLHLDNVLFHPDDVPVILDWSHACRGPSIIDVVRVFVEGMTVETRRRHAEDLLEGYVEARSRWGHPSAGPQRLQEEVRAAVLWHLAYVITWAGAESPGFDGPRVRAIVDSLVRNATTAASDLL